MNDKLGIINLTNRTISEITLTNLTNSNYQYYEKYLEPYQNKEFKLEDGIYLVTASRQLPIILLVSTDEDKQLNPLEQKIKDHEGANNG